MDISFNEGVQLFQQMRQNASQITLANLVGVDKSIIAKALKGERRIHQAKTREKLKQAMNSTLSKENNNFAFSGGAMFDWVASHRVDEVAILTALMARTVTEKGISNAIMALQHGKDLEHILEVVKEQEELLNAMRDFLNLESATNYRERLTKDPYSLEHNETDTRFIKSFIEFEKNFRSAFISATRSISSHYMQRGFETHAMYTSVLCCARKRLWVFGRKNKKLFDRSFIPFYEKLGARINHDNFSFRILFLSPNDSNAAMGCSQNIKGFKDSLIACIETASDILQEYSVSPETVCRMYTGVRNNAFLIVDDVVLYVPTKYSDDGVIAHFTGSPFDMVNLYSPKGELFFNTFEEKWGKSSWEQIF